MLLFLSFSLLLIILLLLLLQLLQLMLYFLLLRLLSFVVTLLPSFLLSFSCLSLFFTCVFRTDAGNKAAKCVMRPQKNITRKSRSPVKAITAQVCPSGSLSGARMTSQQLPTEKKGIIISCFPYFASKDLGSIPLRLSFLFKKVVVCGHRLVTLSLTSY